MNAHPSLIRAASPRLTCLLLLILAACRGGDGSSSGNDTPRPDPPPESGAASIETLDAVPQDGATQVDPAHGEVSLSHFGYVEFSIDITGDCAGGTTLERSLVDLSQDFDALFEHNQSCGGLAASDAYETLIEAAIDGEDTFELRHGFSTNTEMAPALQVQDSVTTPRDTVADLFRTFIDESLIDRLDVPDALASVVAEAVEALAESAYGELVNPEPLFSVTAQRVTYASRQPDGNASSELTGLVVVPDTSSADFTPRDTVIVLNHSTGATPGDLAVTDVWYVVANLFAARGYLVIAPDNWGRGGTSAEPETFLMAARTAASSLDMIRAVLAGPGYEALYQADSPRITIVGYSQGGHAALALWQTLAAQAPSLEVPQVYAGGGPYNLYATIRGVVQQAAGSCDDDVYCRFVTDDTAVTFLSERVLPGYVTYADNSLTLSELVEGETLASSFLDGFLGNDPMFDRLKGQLQQSSFTNITGGLDGLSDTGTAFTLFHSRYDRLVPIANSDELVSVLEPHFAVDFRADSCESAAYEVIFDVTDHAGILHALCELEMLNEVFGELR